ncbi:heavy metal translocating P-type ATPase [Cyanobium sp. BA5m-21]|nr:MULTISPECIES: heavy metal translocating P-type ATPase [unclassified Cyanobium]MCP9903876.1 heavy metal translocating P-type ATPase [Cyanobium sp. BA5m-10]MCP9907776.1 heavy metal translocating P-type ATPase [Cyanobium sp. BA5m-21]
MKCGGCVRAVEQRLLDQPGVRQASVNLLTRTAWVDLASAEADQGNLVEALAELGFQARLRSTEIEFSSRRERLRARSWWQQWRQLVVALLLLLVSVLGHLPGAGLGDLWIHALVATAALAGPGRPILVRGIQGALAGLPSMDTLVGLGVFSAYGASLVAFLWPQTGWPCFFNEPVMLLGFVLLGRFLEERARFRTGRALEQLAELQPDTALLLLGDGPSRPVRVGGLRPGDRVRLLPGDRVPVDGVVLEGCSAVDVSGLTGEPLPLQAAAGSELAAGSLNLEAPLVLEVSRRGADSAIARIIHLVERAQARKAPIQALVDRIAGRFTLVVLALAVATLLFWWLLGTEIWPQVLNSPHAAGHAGGHAGHGVLGTSAETPFALALQLAIAVLVVACPCALGLATPTAITVGTGRAAREGLLFRGGDAIETAARLQAVLFDKTGTLTLGRALVAAVEPLADLDADRLVQLAASLEAGSRHPLGQALLQEAQRRDLALFELGDSHTTAGEGVAGLVEGRRLRVGRLAWVEPAPSAQLLARQALLECQGASVLALADDQLGLLGLVAINDQPRPDAAAVLAALRGMDLELGLLSGDRREPVQQLGRRLGLAEAELAWELRPEQKLERILKHPAYGALAMVGDGINDAPALAAADLGIAVGTGTQIAQDSADLVVMGEQLDGIVRALLLARRTMAKVRQNLAWAFGYNLIVLPLAAGVLLPGFGLLLTPPLAALLMALSSITVVANALLLQDGRDYDS